LSLRALRWTTFSALVGLLSLLILAPIGSFLVLSFASLKNGVIDHAFSVQNYVDIVSSPTYLGVIWQTIVLCAGVMATTMMLGYPVAYFIWRRSPRWRSFWLLLFSLPLLMSYIVKIYTMRSILGVNGPLNSLLVFLGILDSPTPIFLFNRLSIFVTMSVILLPFALFPIYMSLAQLPKNLIHAAADLGATHLTTFRFVILPLTLPGTLAGGLFTFILAFGDYITPEMVGGPNGFTVGRMIWSQFGLAFNWPFGAALGAVVLLLALTAIAAASLINQRGEPR